MKNNYLVTFISVVLIGGIAFYGGLSYQKNKDSLAGLSVQDLPAKLQSLGLAGGGSGGAGTFAGRNGGRRGVGGAVMGVIISKDDQSITVKLRDGSTKIVYLSASTTVGAIVSASSSDLAVGKTIVVSGTANSDGSVAATTVQIRPAGIPTPAQ
jgi:hypothetical protein